MTIAVVVIVTNAVVLLFERLCARAMKGADGKCAIPVLLVHAHCWLYVYVDSAAGRRLWYPSRAV